jgi:thioredoxin-like negative regulator of GroEL
LFRQRCAARLALGRHAAALADCEVAAARLPGDPDIATVFAMALAGVGRRTEALAAVDAGLRTTPGHSGLRALRSRLASGGQPLPAQ